MAFRIRRTEHRPNFRELLVGMERESNRLADHVMQSGDRRSKNSLLNLFTKVEKMLDQLLEGGRVDLTEFRSTNEYIKFVELSEAVGEAFRHMRRDAQNTAKLSTQAVSDHVKLLALTLKLDLRNQRREE